MRVFSGRTDPGKERTALSSDGELIGIGETAAWIAGGMRGYHERAIETSPNLTIGLVFHTFDLTKDDALPQACLL